MKQKLFFLISTFLLATNFSINSFAIDLNKISREINKATGSDSKISKSLNDVSNIDKKIKEALEDVKKETLGKVDEKINEVKEKVDGELQRVNKIVDEAEDGINKFKDLKNKAQKYINLAKMIVAFLSGGIVVSLFFIWRIWRNIISFKKIVRNVTNYDDIKNQIKALEAEVVRLGGKTQPAPRKGTNTETKTTE